MEVAISGDPYLNSTYFIPLSKLLKQNIFNNNDIYISDIEFLKFNTDELYICIVGNTNYNDKDTLDCRIYGKKYSIIVGEAVIYESTLGEGNIYPVNNIPFNLLKYHKLTIVIHDVDITDYDPKICIKCHHIKSQKNTIQLKMK